MSRRGGLRSTLAVHGGTPVRDPDRGWPRWPAPPPETERNLLEVLHGERWTLSSPGDHQLYERRFSDEFAAYVGSRYCVPVDHGSSALIVALEALGLDHGARVLVPTLTWVACATAVLRAGLVPVLVDVDPITGSMGPQSIDLGVDAQAALVVHWSCAMADVPAIAAVAAPRGIEVIEDCAQAHGAEWNGRRAGSIGRIGCFSMQHGKVLTCGEGGAVVTDDDRLAGTLEELRADARRYRPGRNELEETATVMGANFCMSEFHAAVLCAQLSVLDAQHATRWTNFQVLAEQLADVPSVRVIEPTAAQTRASIYEVPFVFDARPNGMTSEELAAALTAELGRAFYLSDTPLHRSPLLCPSTKPALAGLAGEFAAIHRGRTFEHADRLYDSTVVTHHSALLGDEQDMVDIATAIAKVIA